MRIQRFDCLKISALTILICFLGISTVPLFPQSKEPVVEDVISYSRSFRQSSIPKSAPFYIDISVESERLSLMTISMPYNNKKIQLGSPQSVIEYQNTQKKGVKTIFHRRYPFLPIQSGEVSEMMATVFIADTVSNKVFPSFKINSDKDGESIESDKAKGAPTLLEKVARKKRITSPVDSPDIFLKATLSNDQVYTGEGVIYTLKLYRKRAAYQWRSIIFSKPQFNQINAYELTPKPERLESLNGERFYVLDLLKLRLFPSQEGEQSLEMPMVLFKNASYPKGMWLTHPELTLSVAELPSKVEMPGFSTSVFSRVEKSPESLNRVGVVSMSDKLEEGPYLVGRPFSYQVELMGSIDFSAVKELSFEPVPGLDIFSKKSSLKRDSKSGEIKGRIFEYVILPKSIAIDSVPIFSITYFDNRQNKWLIRQSSSPPLLIQEPEKAGDMNGLSRRQESRLYPVKPGLYQVKLYTKDKVVLLGLFGVCLVFLSEGIYRRLIKLGGLKRLKGYVYYYQRRYHFQRRLKKLRKKRLFSESDKGLYRQFLVSVHEYLGCFFEAPLRGVSKRQFYQLMADKKVLPNHAAQLYGVLQGIEVGLVQKIDPQLLMRQLSVLSQIIQQLEQQK
tara:strand:+ start:5176 stop:7032 length:1857 start_codon:yes stop_codon:yes gene_type:complete